MSIFGKAFVCVRIWAKDRPRVAKLFGSEGLGSNLESARMFSSTVVACTSKEAMEIQLIREHRNHKHKNTNQLATAPQTQGNCSKNQLAITTWIQNTTPIVWSRQNNKVPSGRNPGKRTQFRSGQTREKNVDCRDTNSNVNPWQTKATDPNVSPKRAHQIWTNQRENFGCCDSKRNVTFWQTKHTRSKSNSKPNTADLGKPEVPSAEALKAFKSLQETANRA